MGSECRSGGTVQTEGLVMRKLYILLAVVLTACASIDRSEVSAIHWNKLETIPGETVYVGLTSRTGKLERMYVLYDFDYPHQVADIAPLSSVEQIEVDCASNRLRSVYIAYYYDHMTAGKLLFSRDLNFGFYPAEQKTLYGDLLKAACA